MTYDVIIVGGGLAGLSAAYTLTRLPEKRKIALFEASDHVGGRILPHFSINGDPVHHPLLNSVLQQHNLKTKPLSVFNSDTFDSQGNKVSLKEIHTSLRAEYNKSTIRIQEAKRQSWIHPPPLI